MPLFSTLKKKYRIATEKVIVSVTGSEGTTELTHDFQDMEKRCKLFEKLVSDLLSKTQVFLYPDTNARVKLAMSKATGHDFKYPWPEMNLSNALSDHGQKILNIEKGNVYAEALIEVGETLQQMSELKTSLESNLNQDFLTPIQDIQKNELKELCLNLKKFNDRKLDYDYKKRHGESYDGDVKVAGAKFSESLEQAQLGMENLLENKQVEHISQLTSFAEHLLEYHQECSSILRKLTSTLQEIQEEAKIKLSEKKADSQTELKSLDDDLDSESSWDEHNNADNDDSDASADDDEDQGLLCSGAVVSKQDPPDFQPSIFEEPDKNVNEETKKD